MPWTTAKASNWIPLWRALWLSFRQSTKYLWLYTFWIHGGAAHPCSVVDGKDHGSRANQLQTKWHVSFRVKHVSTSTRLCRSCARTTGKFADTGVAASQSPRVSESGVEAPASLKYSFATKQTCLVHSLWDLGFVDLHSPTLPTLMDKDHEANSAYSRAHNLGISS